MGKIEDKPSLEELIQPTTPSTDAEYLKWKERKIEAALKEANRQPEMTVPSHLVWKRFGLEY